jgi:hypothetical protein
MMFITLIKYIYRLWKSLIIYEHDHDQLGDDAYRFPNSSYIYICLVNPHWIITSIFDTGFCFRGWSP